MSLKIQMLRLSAGLMYMNERHAYLRKTDLIATQSWKATLPKFRNYNLAGRRVDSGLEPVPARMDGYFKIQMKGGTKRRNGENGKSEVNLTYTQVSVRRYQKPMNLLQNLPTMKGQGPNVRFLTRKN